MAAPASAMQREPVALIVMAVLLAVARLLTSGDEGRQAIDVAAISGCVGGLRTIVVLLPIVMPRLLVARRVGLLLLALIRLRIVLLMLTRRMRFAAKLRL
jgi:hypothetical protein